jgi:hypothetical protein
VIFAIDDAAAKDVMVFRMVRRSGLLYRIVSSLAAVCFDCLLEVVWLATNTARLGFGTMVRNHDSLAATGAERTSVAPWRRGSGHLPISNLANSRKEGAGNVRCFATLTASLAELRSMRASLTTGTPLPPAFPARWFDGLVMMRWGMPPPPRAGGFPVTNIRNTTSQHWRGWLKPENRCLVPANSFAEYAPEPNPETKKDVFWIALNEDRPLFSIGGL